MDTFGIGGTKRKMNGKSKKKKNPAPHHKYPRYLTPEEERLAQMYKPTPSMIAEEMSGSVDSTLQRKKYASPEILEFTATEDLNSVVPVDEPLFQPYPLHLQFREYEEFGVYKQTLYFRNNDSAPRSMRVVQPDSQYFSIHPNPRLSNRVAPGMEISYEVTFKPHKKDDYKERLICITDREKFVVEISALGPWACIDFPDQVGFGTCPVNMETTRTFLVRNVGEQETKFTLNTTGPFDVQPKNGFIGLGNTMQITLSFKADRCTDYEGEMEILYENGQKSYMHLHGSAETLNVTLDKPIIEVDSAYITLTSTCTVKIQNDSDVPVDFDWSSFQSRIEDEDERNRLHEQLDNLEREEYDQLDRIIYPDDHPESSMEGDSNSTDDDYEDDYEDDIEEELLIGGGGSRNNNEEDFMPQEKKRRKIPLAKRRDRAAIKQKYRNLHRAVNEEKMLFADENFKIEPLTGKVWSHSVKECTITFHPLIAADYVCIASLSVAGRENRLPLKMLGQGIGPKAGFLTPTTDVGKVFVGSSHQYQLEIENRGDIPCEFSLDESNSAFANYIKFTPSSGVLKVESTQIVTVDFCCDQLGDFSEIFTFSMKGSNDKMRCKFKGNVVGPTFYMNISQINFERVAYGSCNTKILQLHNTSEISMEYSLRVPGDGKFDQPEFVLTPTTGFIKPGEFEEIRLDFTARTLMKFNMQLVVDVIGIGSNLLEIPISGECAVANVCLIPTHEKIITEEEKEMDNFKIPKSGALVDGIEHDEDRHGSSNYLDMEEEREGDVLLNFEECFIRHAYKMPLILRNSSDVKAFFEIQKQDEATFCVATYEVLEYEGVIEPMSEIKIQVTLKCEKLGKLALPLYVKILGSDKPPLMIDIMAMARGPRVILSDAVIDFGNVQCLKQEKKIFTMTNQSCIPAPYRTFLKGGKSRFNIDCYEGCLGPGESVECEVTICADDSVLHKDELHLFITEGGSLVIPVRAKGCGTTLFCEKLDELKSCSFGSVFTSRIVEKKFLVENRGKREQNLSWISTTVLEKIRERNKLIQDVERMLKDKDPQVQKRAARIRIPEQPKSAFTFVPENVLLKPRMGCMFTIRGESDVPGEIVEKFQLSAKIGKDKMPLVVTDAQASANFLNPLLHASVDVIEFCYTFNPEEVTEMKNEISAVHMTQKRPFKLKNISQLPLNFILKTQEPFAVDTWEISLEPEEEITLTVLFDPFVSDDLKSQTILGKLVAVHQNHPQNDTFSIRAQINFPNLDFEYNQINFGCVMNETTKTMKVRMTNNSIIDTMYSWVFLQDDDDDNNTVKKGGKKSGGNNNNNSNSKLDQFEPNQVFDIRPIRGLLRPGEFQDVEVSFFGYANRKCSVTALCEVEGGPEYELLLKGEASDVSYKLDQSGLDFGDLIHDKSEEKEFTIFNTSKVTFDFRTISSRPDIVNCTPSEGRIFAKDFQKITVKFTPGIPDKIQQDIMLEIAHFEPFAFPVTGRGIFSSISLSLPRYEEITLSELQQNLVSKDEDNTIIIPEEIKGWNQLVAQAESNLNIHTNEEDKKAAQRPHTTLGFVVDQIAGAAYNPPKTAPSAISNTRETRTSMIGGKRKRGGKKIVGGGKFNLQKVSIETEANRLKFVRFLEALPLQHGKRNLFKISSYVLDFGNIVVGKSESKSFRVLNTGPQTVSLDIDKTVLLGGPFKIEPGSVTRICEEDSVDISVHFSAKRGIPLGLVQTKVLVDIRNGPPVELILKATVTMPDIVCSHDVLSFDSILVGQCKVIHWQIQNTSPVVANWCFDPHALQRGQGKNKKTNSLKNNNNNNTNNNNFDVVGGTGEEFKYFTCSPSSGSLQPNERCNIAITFIPNEQRVYEAKLPFKVTSNPKPKILTCKGEGHMLSIQVSKDLLELNPTLPSGSDVARSEFSISNPTPYDVEIFSVDFDEQYLREESMIQKVLDSGTFDGSIIMTNPRKVGDELQQNIVEIYNEIIKKEDPPPSPVPMSEEEQEVSINDNDVGELEDMSTAQQQQQQPKKTYRERDLAIDIIVLNGSESVLTCCSDTCGVAMDNNINNTNQQEIDNNGDDVVDETMMENKEEDVVDESKEEIKQTIGLPILSLDDIIEWAAKTGYLEKQVCDHLGLEFGGQLSEEQQALYKKNKKLPTKPIDEAILLQCLKAKLYSLEGSGGVVLNGIDCKYTPDMDITVVASTLKFAMQNPHLIVVGSVHKTSDDDEEPENQQYQPVIDIFSPPPRIDDEEKEIMEEEEQLMKMMQQEPSEIMLPPPIEISKEDNNDLVTPPRVLYLEEGEEKECEMKIQNFLPTPGTPRPEGWDDPFFLAIPSEQIFQRISFPPRRAVRRDVSKKFVIETLSDPNDKPADESNSQQLDDSTNNNKSRWIIPSNGSINLRVMFDSRDIGSFEEQLSFELVGGQRQYWVVTKGTCTVPTISSDPRNVFMNRIKGRPEHKLVSKKYNMSTGIYEFGPLLMGRDPNKRNDTEILKKQYSETFRISNSGILPIDKVEFSFILGDGKSESDTLAIEDESVLPFMVEPNNLSLEPGETKDLTIWAIPQSSGNFNATLVASIKDNPDLVYFKISCIGCAPSLNVGGPWDEITSNEEDEKDQKVSNDKGENVLALEFDRLLLGRHEERIFSVENTGNIPILWKLDLGALGDVEQFSISPTEGILAPKEKSSIITSFEATERKTYDYEIKINYSNTEDEATKKYQTIPIKVRAEAYDIKVNPSMKQDEKEEQEPGRLDFQLLRVFDQCTRILSLENVGKYPVNYKFNIRKKSTRELIHIEPMEGLLEPSEVGKFQVTFSSQTQVSLRNNKDIQCIIIEPATNEVVETFEVPVFAQSVFSEFRIHPQKGIHFGAVKFDSKPSKTFEIKNDGDFDFSFEILSQNDLEAKRKQLNEELVSKTEDGDEMGMKQKLSAPNENVPTDKLELGMFEIEPRGGIVAPGSVTKVSVTFHAQGSMNSQEKCRILVSGRNPVDGELLTGIPFEFVGESHIPGINTNNYDSIFEEQAVVRCFDPETNEMGFFSTDDRTFSFGAVVHTSVPSTGICERFKISNPNKIKAEVDLEITPRTATSEGVFSVHPTHIELPPHEYEFVSVYFKPNAMCRYAANFKATVVDGSGEFPLSFDLQGEGTLPCLTVVEPAVLQDNATYLIDHGKVQVGKTKTRQLTIRNDGIVPTTVRYDMPVHDSFSFPLRNCSLTLKSKEAHTTTISYTAQNEGEQSCELLLRVLHNEFELSRFKLVAEGYQEDLTFEDLPEGGLDDGTLIFGDTPLKMLDNSNNNDDEEKKANEAEFVAEKVVQFTIRSNCEDPIRFQWENFPHLTVSPSIGHVQPYGLVEVEAKLHTNQPMNLEDTLKVKFIKIQYTEEAFAQANGSSIHWDDRMTIVTENTEEKEVDGEDEEMEKFKTIPAPEPPFVEKEKTERKELGLRCTGVVDHVIYAFPEGTSKDITFRPTMMFQSRVFKYIVKNPSEISMNLNWEITQHHENAGAKKNTHCPFSISPTQATIEGGTEQPFTIRFSPLEVEDFNFVAKANIQNLKASEEPLCVHLSGLARRPICHFEMDTSNYLERRLSTLPPLVGVENAKVLEFESLGVRVKNTKRFHVVNPMNVSYEYELEPVGEINPKFKCATQRGVILPGKRYEIVFSFTPEDVQLQESVWSFKIPDQNVSQTFLLVGTVREPKVDLERKHLNFHSVLVGGHSSETVQLYNNEDIPFAFTFDAKSFIDQENDSHHGDESKKKRVLKVEPMSGTVGANSSLPITIHFSPGSEKPHNFNLVCVVHRKPNRLSLNVKGEGSAVHDCLVLNGKEEVSDLVLSAGEKAVNILDFGPVHVNDFEERKVQIQNRGKFNFDFVWVLPVEYSEIDDSILSLSPLKGTVPCGESITCCFKFHPKVQMELENMMFQCTVAGARKYNVSVSGSGSKPLIHFSSYRFDFGPCFIADVGASSRTEEQTLIISNNEMDCPVAFDCLHEKTEYLDVNCEPTVLQPGEKLEVPIRFTPRELKSYSGSIPFEINGLYTVNILFIGEGTVLKFELENPENQKINFGSLRVGQKVTKQIKAINKSKRAISFRLIDREEAGRGRLEEQSVSFTPHSVSAHVLRPRESCLIRVTFAPDHRLSPFSENLYVEVNGTEKKLTTVTGSCQAVDVKLESSSVNFGSVCESCTLTKKVQIHNDGDLGAKFKWELVDKRSKQDFSIFPMDGLLPPHTQLMIDMTFHPSTVADELRTEVRLVVDGNDPSTMPLSMFGSCMPQPDEGIKELDFKCKVRETEKKSIIIENDTKTLWQLQPTIHNAFWSGPTRLDIAPNSKATYDLEYCPLIMTKEEEIQDDDGNNVTKMVKHEGSVFFALPNGTALLYKLLGEADAPDVEETIEKTVPSKSPLFIPLKVKNWFRMAQRMNVEIEKLNGPDDHFYKGARSLDIPANGSRDYKLNFMGYVEGMSEAKITLTNTQSGEYVFFIVKMKVEKPVVQSIIKLESLVRQSSSTVITIENPFYGTSKQVVFEPEEEKSQRALATPKVSWWKCDNPYIRVKSLNAFATSAEGTFEIEYRPLLPTTTNTDDTQKSEDDYETSNLILNCPELGTYPYTLKLYATTARSERSLNFHSTLGSTDEQVFRFTHFVGSKPTEYKNKVGQPLFFQVTQTLKANPTNLWTGNEEVVSVKFEPQGLGEVKDVLTVTSPDGGEYTCALYGVCEPPRPQGPFLITDAGKGISIEFKNIFGETKEFRFIVDSEHFTVNGSQSQTIKLDARKSTNVTVKTSTSNTTGKLLVSCVNLPDLPAWTYYIKS